MEFIIDSWLPILLSAIGVFVVSAIIHMCLPVHKKDYRHLDDEERVLASIRESGAGPGEYMFPAAESMKDLASPPYIEKCNRGPVGYITLLPNEIWNMNRNLLQWFGFSVLVSVFTAYVASFTLEDGATFEQVLRLTGTVATAIYALGRIPDSIWRGIPWATTGKFIMDGMLYGLTTGVVFALL